MAVIKGVRGKNAVYQNAVGQVNINQIILVEEILVLIFQQVAEHIAPACVVAVKNGYGVGKLGGVAGLGEDAAGGVVLALPVAAQVVVIVPAALHNGVGDVGAGNFDIGINLHVLGHVFHQVNGARGQHAAGIFLGFGLSFGLSFGVPRVKLLPDIGDGAPGGEQKAKHRQKTQQGFHFFSHSITLTKKGL